MNPKIVFGVLVAISLTACGLDASQPLSGEKSNDSTVSVVNPISIYIGLNELLVTLGQIEADGIVNASEWSLQLDPILSQLPHVATPQGDELVRFWSRPLSWEVEADHTSLTQRLDELGYPMPDVPVDLTSADVASILSGSLSAIDAEFERLIEIAGIAPETTVRVAVLDDGLNMRHPIFEGRLVEEAGVALWDFVDGDAVLPETMHGTAVSSLASRQSHRVKVLPMRVAVNAGIPDTLKFGEVVARAMDAAAASGARVVNLSYVTNVRAHVEQIREAMQRNAGILFVLAAGNVNRPLGSDGLEPDRFLPAMHSPNVLVVANAKADGSRFSESFGGSGYGQPYVDVAMRGVGLPVATVTMGYGNSRGTSSAAPNAAAAAARCFLLNPSLSAAEVKEILIATSEVSSYWDGLVNANGLINEAAAMHEAMNRRSN